MADNSFHTTVESLFKGMDSFITTKTVVGDAIHIGDTIILPLVDVSFGVAAGAFSQEKKNNGKNIPAMIIRGGTSKGVYLLKSDLPEECEKWDAILLKMMGSPDKKQIDGLGGSQSVTSKVAIVNKSERADADVDYTFAQVSVDKPIVSYKGNCGNISSGVGPFAIEKGLVDVKEETTPVRIYNTNTGKMIVADVKTQNGKVVYAGGQHCRFLRPYN